MHLRAELRRGLIVVAALAVVLLPVTSVTAAQPTAGTAPVAAPIRYRVATNDLPDPLRPAAVPFIDPIAKVSITPPIGWRLGPDTALNPDPMDPVLEVVRFQLRMGDPSLYAQPLPLTSGLVLDAGAIISVGVVREESALSTLEIDWQAEKGAIASVPGFLSVDDEGTYEGMHTLTRYFVARDTERRLVVRAYSIEHDWAQLAPAIAIALASLRADQNGPSAPAAVPPPPPPPPVVVPAPAPEASKDRSLEVRATILSRAAQMLGLTYVWGGNSTSYGMDCSAYVSRAWGVDRYTTDSIWQVAASVDKEDLRAGDAMDLTIGRDPEGFGHIRIFEAWANEAHSLVWVYEETPPRSVHRVVAYDARYQPIRLAGLSGAGSAAVVPAPLSSPIPDRGFVPSQPREGGRPGETPRPRQNYTPRPFTPRPSTPRPTQRIVTPRPQTPYFAPGVTPTPRPSPTGTVLPPGRTPGFTGPLPPLPKPQPTTFVPRPTEGR
ncbi:MAG: hypothetical protein HY071_03745 [Chloroflexi bacterium]|nr:hypothetical protein [Chloroflexota bacterium]